MVRYSPCEGVINAKKRDKSTTLALSLAYLNI